MEYARLGVRKAGAVQKAGLNYLSIVPYKLSGKNWAIHMQGKDIGGILKSHCY